MTTQRTKPASGLSRHVSNSSRDRGLGPRCNPARGKKLYGRNCTRYNSLLTEYDIDHPEYSELVY